SVNPTTFTWNALGASAFTLEVSKDQEFSSLVANITDLNVKSKQVFDLEYNTVYYWRVGLLHGAAPGLSEVRSFTTIVAAPAVPLLDFPANGETGVSTSLTLSWDSVSTAASYHVQISTDEEFSNLVVDEAGVTDTKLDVPGLENGTLYYWRVSATNVGGTSIFSTVQNFTTIITAPLAPLLALPLDGATDVPVAAELSWNASLTADSYRLQVATDSIFSSPIFDQSELTGTSQVVSELANNTKYFWRVSATNVGGTSLFSTVQNFTTVIAAPLAPLLALPLDGATDVPVAAELSWNASLTADSYRLQVSANSDLSSPVFDQSGLTDTSQVVPGLANNTKYFWLVSATNVGGTSVFSTVQSFTTIVAAPIAPLLASPADEATDISLTPTLSWSGVDGAESYRVQVSTDADFGVLVADLNNITTTETQVGGLINSTQYYWRVSAINVGGMSAFSEINSFTTIITAPLAPLLALPVDGATDVPVAAELSWNTSLTADSYRLQVATDLGFTSLVFDQSGLTDTLQIIPGLVNNTVYYWRVRATNVGGTSVFSTVQSFTTIIAPPLPPLLALPADGATDVLIDAALTWSTSLTVDSYRLQVSTDFDFTSTVFDKSGLTDTSHSVPGLTNNTQYYWRVSATNLGGTSLFSIARSFTTIIAAPLAPVLVTPVDGATDISTEVEFFWSPLSPSDSYRLQIATDSTFSSPVHDQEGLMDSVVVVDSLEHGTLYYWRVNATNFSGTSLFSTVHSFTTIIATPLAPLLTWPDDGAVDVPLATTLMWNGTNGAESYHVQLSTDSGFSNFVVDQGGITETTLAVSGLDIRTKYYWRVSATNAGGTSQYSNAQNFTTVFLVAGGWQLALPLAGAMDVSLTPTLSWDSLSYAEWYLVEVSTDSNFSELVINQPNITETEIQLDGLLNNTSYYWRVAAVFSYSMSEVVVYSEERSFTTIAAPTSVERLNNGIPETFALQQNFPNPFNPQTTIQFSVAKESRVTLAIFNMLGATVEVLADQTFAPGNYQVQWTPENLPSGVYFYRLRTADFTRTRKLLLLR
ncbi:MAG: T9SS type A sorting domain-containing protein, partial [Nitrososphaera sp.]|nr:T9SS type A sorting domain-containing protein [Nitrososphaera sp.]